MKTIYKPKHEISFRVTRLSESPEPVVGSRLSSEINLIQEIPDVCTGKVSLFVEGSIDGQIPLTKDDSDTDWYLKEILGGVVP